MTPLAQALKKIRVNQRFKSARSFFQYLSERQKLNFNYAYYARIEASEAIPSAEVVEVMTQTLSAQESDELILSYCESLFPKKKHLFQRNQFFGEGAPKKESTTTSSHGLKKELTIQQVRTISQSQNHYFFFVMITLARKGLQPKELEQFFSIKELKKVLEDCQKAKLIYEENQCIFPSNVEILYPKASDFPELVQIYKQLDQWDGVFAQKFKFEVLEKKMHLRRISSRFLDLIQANCGFLNQLIRSSEELDPRYNDEVLHFEIRLERGRIPG